MITYDDFLNIDIRLGEIVEVQDFPKARHPAYKIHVFFGDELGYRWSSAQLTNYTKDELMGRQVVAVVNFPPKNIAGFLSECLILGVPCANEEDGQVALLSPLKLGVVGGRLY